MVKLFFKLGGDEIEKTKFHSSKNPIVIGDVDITKWITSDAQEFGKNKKKLMLTFSWDTRITKKFDHYTSSYQKWMSMSLVSKKPNACLLR